MRLESSKMRTAATVAAGLILYSSIGATTSLGDEPGLIGQLFRMGNSSSSSSSGPASNSGPASSPSSATPAPSYYGQPAVSTPASTASSLPVKPRPRINKPITEADPLVTRISLGRSDNGSQFGMLLQVFADGTVIDGEGVHHVSGEALKPVVDAVASGELARLRGHCGGPAGDFIENVQVIVFERSMGRLRANSFSYSGSAQGCDHAIHHLQKVLDELQTRITPNASANPPTTSNAPASNHGLNAPPLPLTTP